MTVDLRYLTRYLSSWPSPTRRAEPTSPTTSVQLACGHTNTYDEPAPRPGTLAYCRSCAAYTRVTKETTDAQA